MLARFRGRCPASFWCGASPPGPRKRLMRVTYGRGGAEPEQLYTDWKGAVVTRPLRCPAGYPSPLLFFLLSTRA